MSALKVSIIGCGHVGVTTAYTMLLDGTPSEIVLLSRDKDKAIGEALDLEHALPFLDAVTITPTDDYADIKDSKFVVITAGAAQKPGQTRLDLVETNIKILKSIIPKIVEASPDAVILIVSNPVDVLTFVANKMEGVKPGKIFGSGTILDTARLRFHLAEKLKVNPSSIHAYILGEHGDSSFPVFSSATVGGQPINELKEFDPEEAKKAFTQARDAAYKIINAKGATFYAIATAVTEIMDAVLRDEKKVLPVSVPINDFHGVSDVALSVPCIIGKNGVERQLQISMDENEMKLLKKSADVLKQFL